jgi:iron complex transport system substrate-binding protein
VLAYTTENVPTMRVATDESQLGQTISSLGLVNAWPGEGDQYGSDVITVEGLLEVADANFFYVAQDSDNIFENQLAEDPIWNSLTFVQEGRTYALGGDTWIYGGPVSLEVIVERTIEAFLGGE